MVWFRFFSYVVKFLVLIVFNIIRFVNSSSSTIVGYPMGLLPPKQHREREKLLCYSGPKSVRECAELSIGCDVITKGRVWD